MRRWLVGAYQLGGGFACAMAAGTSSTPASSSTTAAWWPAPTRWAAGALGSAPTLCSTACFVLSWHNPYLPHTHPLPTLATPHLSRLPALAFLQNKPDTNGSQFFVTLDRADHCNRQYTIFGKITGAAPHPLAADYCCIRAQPQRSATHCSEASFADLLRLQATATQLLHCYAASHKL